MKSSQDKFGKFQRKDGERFQRPSESAVPTVHQAPRDVEAEFCLLGSMLLKPDVSDDIATLVRSEDFYDPVHGVLFDVLMEMYNSNKAIDEKLIVARLKESGDLEKIGGLPFIAKLAVAVPHAAHAADYAQLIRNHALRRELINAATSILQDAHSEDAPTEVINRSEQRIFEIYDGRDSSSIMGFEDLLNSAMDRLDSRLRGTHDDGSVESGFHDLDQMMGGLHNSELIILAARPSMGKTAFAMNIAEHAAIEEKAPVLFVSLEMSGIELIDRMLCSLAKVNGHRMRTGTVKNEDRQRLVDKAAEISAAPMYVDDSPSRSVTEIAAAGRRIKKKEGNLGLIVIDYLQLIEPDNARDPRQEQVAKIARRLKGLARELEVPILCLAQLNRQAEAAKDNHRPRLSHLRESGAIEQDADVVMFVHREEYYRTGDEAEEVAGQAEIIIAKQRNGPIGDVKLLWQKEYTRFVSQAVRAYDEIEQFNSAAMEDF
jgi:replicative DNA helicase